MATSVLVAACRALMVTDGAGDEVCSSCPEPVTVMMADERQTTRYRPGGSQTENFPEFPTVIVTGRCPTPVRVTVPGIGRSPGCLPPGPIGPPSMNSLPVR